MSRISQEGAPQEVFENPSSSFVARFMGMKNSISGELVPMSKDEPGPEGVRHFVPTQQGVPQIVVTSQEEWSGRCFVVIPENAVVCAREPLTPPPGNMLRGQVTDMAPTQAGVEVVIDCGLHLSAVLSRSLADSMKIAVGDLLWAGFDASDVRILGKNSAGSTGDNDGESA